MPPTPKPPAGLLENVPLAPRTTLEVGGSARYLARCAGAGELADVLDWGRSRGLEVFVLGGGSNLLVADAGFDGLVVELTGGSVEIVGDGETALVRAEAGCDWDALVARTVAAGLGGIECLSGIPGRVGAAPIQNVGAYGQEVAGVLEAVEVIDLADGVRRELPAAGCGFGYRQSHFKGRWHGRYAVTRVDLRLPRRTLGTVEYPDLARRLEGVPEPGLEDVREAVLAVRRSKSMVLDPDDPNRRSAGSFFVNPVVSAVRAGEIRALASGPMPAFPAADGRVKLSAARLIEEAGFRRGDHQERTGFSSRHVLALINRGGATAAEVVDLAATVRRRVRDLFGVSLRPEPFFLGFTEPVEELLA